VSEFHAHKTEATDSFFRAFCVDAAVKADTYDAVSFGHTEEAADALLERTLFGLKRATSSLAADYGPGKDKRPAVGDYVVLCDGRNKPRLVWRTTEIAIKPFDAVDESFAFDYGEGEQTRAWWLEHIGREYAAEAGAKGLPMNDTTLVVFERFTIVWPRLFADGPKELG
jgi:uncharacterized protein YhfF